MKKIPKRTLSSFLTSARKSSFRHFLENIPGSYVKWVVFFMRKHGASFDFAWFHDNDISDYRGNNNLWMINLISEEWSGGGGGGGFSYTCWARTHCIVVITLHSQTSMIILAMITII